MISVRYCISESMYHILLDLLKKFKLYDRQDIVLCRSYRGLADRIMKEGEGTGLQCQVLYWTGAWEVEEFFHKLP